MRYIYRWFYAILSITIALLIVGIGIDIKPLFLLCTTMLTIVTIIVYAAFTYADKTHLEAKHIQELAMIGQEVQRINDKMGIESLRSRVKS